MEKPMMKCGHTANAWRINKDGTKEHSCVICACTEQAEAPKLTGRKAKCTYYGQPVGMKNETYFPKLMTQRNGRNCCGSIVESDMTLPFFSSHPDKEYDEFYCGCFGWD